MKYSLKIGKDLLDFDLVDENGTFKIENNEKNYNAELVKILAAASLKQKGIKITSSCNALSTLTASLILPLRVLTFTKSPG